MNYKEQFSKQLNHRTIREFKDQPLEPELIEALLEVANHTATSTGMQNYSIIRVNDPKKKEKIAQVANQEYVARVPELWIFIVDAFRNKEIAREQGVVLEAERDMDRFFQGFTDSALAAQNVTNAVESIDLGAVYFGSILNDPQEIIDILELPELTFPVVGIGFGHPNQDPQLKPRMPKELKFFEDHYLIYDSYMDQIHDYDQAMTTYYDLREANKRVDSFSSQVIKRLETANPLRQDLVNVIVKQGFDLKLK